MNYKNILSATLLSTALLVIPLSLTGAAATRPLDKSATLATSYYATQDAVFRVNLVSTTTTVSAQATDADRISQGDTKASADPLAQQPQVVAIWQAFPRAKTTTVAQISTQRRNYSLACTAASVAMAGTALMCLQTKGTPRSISGVAAVACLGAGIFCGWKALAANTEYNQYASCEAVDCTTVRPTSLASSSSSSGASTVAPSTADRLEKVMYCKTDLTTQQNTLICHIMNFWALAASRASNSMLSSHSTASTTYKAFSDRHTAALMNVLPQIEDLWKNGPNGEFIIATTNCFPPGFKLDNVSAVIINLEGTRKTILHEYDSLSQKTPSTESDKAREQQFTRHINCIDAIINLLQSVR